MFMTLLVKNLTRTTHPNWILDAETAAELYMSFYICHGSNFISLLLQTEERGGRKVTDTMWK